MRCKILLYGIAAISLVVGACTSEVTEQTEDNTNNKIAQIAPTVSCQYPTQAPAPSAGRMAFNNYTWQMFVAANWPAMGNARGVADCGRKIGSTTDVVWTSYKTTDETFLPGAADPGPWNTPSKSQLVFSEISKVSSGIQDEIDAQDTIMQPVGGWLVDQSGYPVYYQIAINKTTYDYIREEGFYNRNTAVSAKEIIFPNNSLEVKAAWRWLQRGDNHSRYFTRAARFALYDAKGKSTGEFREGVAGLVGFHIIVKAEGFPQWIWATFEHVDNVPGPGVSLPSFNNPRCTGPYCTPNISPEHSGQPFGIPNQLTRFTPLYPDTVAINDAYQRALIGTPFQYYQLVTSQYPSDPKNPGDRMGAPIPNIAANTTLESYIQAESSCIACHFTARVPGGELTKTDYSFILLHAKAPANYGDAQ